MSGLVRDTHEAREQRLGGDQATVRAIIDASDGCTQFSVSLLRVLGGGIARRHTGAAQELLFVVAGQGRLISDGHEHELELETGALMAPDAHHQIHNPDPDEDLQLVCVALHEPDAEAGAQPPARVTRLADQLAQPATAERTFRIVFDAEGGCDTATQFVGYVPVGAAPRHYHLYEEVIYILEGDGVMHMDGRQAALRCGSVIHLPSRKLHTLENSGPGIMRVLGVFRPAGSPAAAFYPDGTPAYAADELQTTPTAR